MRAEQPVQLILAERSQSVDGGVDGGVQQLLHLVLTVLPSVPVQGKEIIDIFTNLETVLVLYISAGLRDFFKTFLV
jgi:hypothetical protein